MQKMEKLEADFIKKLAILEEKQKSNWDALKGEKNNYEKDAQNVQMDDMQVNGEAKKGMDQIIFGLFSGTFKEFSKR
jgi:hypothetical protein